MAKKRAPGQQSLQDAALGERIAQAYHANRGVYGSPRIYEMLRLQGMACGRKRVARLEIYTVPGKKLVVATVKPSHGPMMQINKILGE